MSSSRETSPPTAEQLRAQWFAEEVQPHEPLLRADSRRQFPRCGEFVAAVQEWYLRLGRARTAGTLRNYRKITRHLCLVLAGQAALQAAIYEVPVGDFNLTRASLRMNLPASLHEVRGIYFWGNGGVLDNRGRATDPEMVALADMLGFVTIASGGLALTYPESSAVGDVPSFQVAIAELARASGHPELVRAPLLPIGHSNGGNTSYDLNAALPELVLATELSKSPGVIPLPPPAALKTPAILVAGEIDLSSRNTGIRARFFDNRARGALWAWVEEQGTDHTLVDSPEIAWPFAEMVARMRYPAGASPANGAVPLIALNEADGWLTDPDSYKTGLAEIAPYTSYTKDKSRAGWLPNRRAAYLFRAFASYDKATPVATITPSARLADPGTIITYTIGQPVAPWNAIEYYEGDTLLKRVVPADTDALSVQFSTMKTGYVVLHALVTFADGRQRTTMPRRALVRVPPVETPETFAPSSIVMWGAPNAGASPPAVAGIKMLAAGTAHMLALKNDGTVVGWGSSFFGESLVPAGLNHVVSLSAGGHCSGAVKSDGTVVMWGDRNTRQDVIPPGLTNVRQISVGQSNVIALRNDGTGIRWGGGLAIELGLKDVAAVAAGTYFSIALKTDGTVVAIESAGFSVPAGLTNVIAISATGVHALALKADGTVVAWGSNSSGESNVPAGLRDVVAVCAGQFHSLALMADGKIVGWGANESGQISLPSSLPPARTIVATQTNSLALIGAQPAFASQPQGQFARPGDYVEFSASPAESGDFSYQWSRNGVLIPGATSATLAFGSVQVADTGVYTVTISNGGSYSTSAGAALAVAGDLPGDATPRLANLSTRAVVGTGGDILIPGIALSGSGKKKLIVRVSGPALATAGVAGALTRPQLRLYSGSTEIASNVGWNNGSGANTTALLSAFAQVGLPPFPAGSADCALLADVDPGVYTATISGVDSTTGVALVEVYEFGPSTAKLVAISCRARVGTDGDVLIPGITIAGSGTKKVIVRVSGPALTAQGVGGALAKPHLEVFGAAGLVADNTGWGTAANQADLAVATLAVGLAPFPAGSADCAVLLTLPTGSYTAKVSGLNNTTGIALVEVYEVP